MIQLSSPHGYNKLTLKNITVIKLTIREKFGLTAPLKLRLKQARTAVFGEEDVPGSKFGLSSLSQLHPMISPSLWRGKSYLKKTVIISNLFNHQQTPIENGWSVQKTQVLDFRGKRLTYNSHNGTDFAIPTGSIVVTAAAGEVVAILSEFNRGGLKIIVDHGNGLMTCYAHLARALVKVGDVLTCGQAIALSGYSGIDGFVTFPFGIPHIHFNVWLNGEPVDPFPYGDYKSLWLVGNLPSPPEKIGALDFIPSVYDEKKVNEAISLCKTKSSVDRLNRIPDLKYKAAHTIMEMNYYPTRFEKHINVYDKSYPREAVLDLPFPKEDFDKVVFIDEL